MYLLYLYHITTTKMTNDSAIKAFQQNKYKHIKSEMERFVFRYIFHISTIRTIGNGGA